MLCHRCDQATQERLVRVFIAYWLVEWAKAIRDMCGF